MHRRRWPHPASTCLSYSDADPTDYRPVIEAQIRAWAGAVGKRAGFAFGEEFRRTRFGGVERWLQTGAAPPDEI
ncbi:MAG: hypothetical protein WD904_00815 [Dehalococcoidia bacterium]